MIYHDDRSGNKIAFFTHFVGYADPERRIELRQPSKTTYERLNTGYLRSDEQDMLLVKDAAALYHFWLVGGAAAIEAQTAERHIPHYLKPKPAVSSGHGAFDFVAEEGMAAATRRAPSKKMRMSILERDNYRCRICGQSPSNDVNIELHVHHIRPWANHGATVESNLVTLCQTCHGGLDPHWNRKLAELIEDEATMWARYNTPPKFDS